jgi:hypothetical protein
MKAMAEHPAIELSYSVLQTPLSYLFNGLDGCLGWQSRLMPGGALGIGNSAEKISVR